MCTTPAADDEKKHLLLTARWNGLAITAHGAILSKHLHFPQFERLSEDGVGAQFCIHHIFSSTMVHYGATPVFAFHTTRSPI